MSKKRVQNKFPIKFCQVDGLKNKIESCPVDFILMINFKRNLRLFIDPPNNLSNWDLSSLSYYLAY